LAVWADLGCKLRLYIAAMSRLFGTISASSRSGRKNKKPQFLFGRRMQNVVKHVRHPELIGGGGLGRLRQAIGCDGLIVVAVGGLDAIAAFLTATEALFRHEPGDAVASMIASFFAQLPLDARSAIGLAAAGMNLVDLLGQGLIFQGAGTGLSMASFPILEA
jgi:hypothetical protein